jgi:hypothetical protein
MNNAKTKTELLQHYSTRSPVRFIQMDGFAPEHCDDLITDAGGFGLTGGATHELMSGFPCVRVLVVPGTDPELVSKILHAAAGFYPAADPYTHIG